MSSAFFVRKEVRSVVQSEKSEGWRFGESRVEYEVTEDKTMGDVRQGCCAAQTGWS